MILLLQNRNTQLYTCLLVLIWKTKRYFPLNILIRITYVTKLISLIPQVSHPGMHFRSLPSSIPRAASCSNFHSHLVLSTLSPPSLSITLSYKILLVCLPPHILTENNKILFSAFILLSQTSQALSLSSCMISIFLIILIAILSTC